MARGFKRKPRDGAAIPMMKRDDKPTLFERSIKKSP